MLLVILVLGNVSIQLDHFSVYVVVIKLMTTLLADVAISLGQTVMLVICANISVIVEAPLPMLLSIEIQLIKQYQLYVMMLISAR